MRLLFIFLLMIANTSVFAELTTGFSIDQDMQPRVSTNMLSTYRAHAIENLTQLLRNSDNPSIGNPKATAVLVEFMDFNCLNSETMDADIQALTNKNPNFRVIYKIIPIHGGISVYAAKAALAANLQGKYPEFHQALMKVGKGLTQNKIITIAKSLGIDTDKLKIDMESAAVKKQLADNMQLFQKIGLLGTPVLFFMRSDISDQASNEDIVLMMGLFKQAELQSVINDLG